MKYIYATVFITLIATLSSCSSEGVLCETGESNLLGCWETEGCLDVSDDNSNLNGKWIKSVYEFNEFGEIKQRTYSYTDNSCSLEKAVETNGWWLSESVIFKYREIESNLENEELEYHEFELEVINDENQSFYEGRYNVHEGRLCTSEGMQFTPTHISLSVSFESSGNTQQIVINDIALNTESCLRRVNET